jgi:hypothetical protein
MCGRRNKGGTYVGETLGYDAIDLGGGGGLIQEEGLSNGELLRGFVVCIKPRMRWYNQSA